MVLGCWLVLRLRLVLRLCLLVLRRGSVVGSLGRSDGTLGHELVSSALKALNVILVERSEETGVVV